MSRDRAISLAFRVLIAAALAIDAVVHLQLAGLYDQAAPGGIGQGNLFRIEAGFAIAAGVLVLVLDRRASFAAAALVLGSGLAAVLVYRYINVPAFGPIPAMYEPIWFAKKIAVTLAEAVGLGLALAGGLVRHRSLP